MTLLSLPQRVADKIQPEPMSGCWLWQASTNAWGYGIMRFADRAWLAHRLIYTFCYGRVPDGDLHHTCGVRSCVNPAHVTEMVPGVHTRMHHLRETCSRCGHPMDDAVIVNKGRNGRTCRPCWETYQRTWHANPAYRTRENAKMRARYTNDQVFRAKVLARQAVYRAKRRAKLSEAS